MSKTSVAVVRCADYHPKTVKTAVDRLLRYIGGFAGLVEPNDSVFLKINHLGNHPIERAINTHPSVVSSFAGSLKAVTGNITVGDSLDSADSGAFETTGFLAMSRENGLRLVNLWGLDYVSAGVPDPHALNAVPIPALVAEAGLVVSFPKLKTHLLTLVTGAVKNNYGYLPLQVRLRLHREHIAPTDFAATVVDVYAASKPGLTVMDGVEALEGNGPSRGGQPRHLGVLIGGRDGVAVDAVASAIIGVEPMSVPTTRMAHERGLGVGDLAEMLGESLKSVRCGDFAKPAGQSRLLSLVDRLPRRVVGAATRVVEMTRPWPHVVPERCTGCGLCASHCPQQTIDMVDGKAHVRRERCISCFCCVEFCPSDAIRPTRSPAALLLTAGVRALSASGRALGHLFRRRAP